MTDPLDPGTPDHEAQGDEFYPVELGPRVAVPPTPPTGVLSIGDASASGALGGYIWPGPADEWQDRDSRIAGLDWPSNFTTVDPRGEVTFGDGLPYTPIQVDVRVYDPTSMDNRGYPLDEPVLRMECWPTSNRGGCTTGTDQDGNIVIRMPISLAELDAGLDDVYVSVFRMYTPEEFTGSNTTFARASSLFSIALATPR